MLTKCSEFLIKRIYRKYESIINNISTSNSKATSAYMRLGKKKPKPEREYPYVYIAQFINC